jgi:hypothetical protein
MEALSPCQRDMLQVTAVYGKSIFEPLVSTELAIQEGLSPKEELLVHPSEFFSIEKINRDEILLTSRPPQFFLQQQVLFPDTSLQSGILFSHKDKFHNFGKNVNLMHQLLLSHLLSFFHELQSARDQDFFLFFSFFFFAGLDCSF